MSDPRLPQIIALASLLAWGVFDLAFDVPVERAATIVFACLATEWLASRARGVAFDARSPLISALSLCLLLRANSEALVLAVAVGTIASKSLLRIDGKHVFNPTTLGLTLGLLLSDGIWVSAGQWGSTAWLVFAIACVGLRVTQRAERSDVTIAFLVAYVGILFGRAFWLGDPIALPLHALQNGALLLFAFFMLSDPRTTPNRRLGRIVFAMLVAGGAVFVQYGLYEPNGLLWSLVVCSLSVPILNRILPGAAYQWKSESPRKPNASKRERPRPFALGPRTEPDHEPITNRRSVEAELYPAR